MGVLTRAALAALALSACIGTTPEDEERAALPPGGEGEPEHRPGQPCLLCHGFALAGTVYYRQSDRAGIEDAEVYIEDEAGHDFTARTNRAGNFIVRVRSGIDAPVQRSRGRLDIPWEPEFPLSIVVRARGTETPMKSLAWREHSCAKCHGPTVEADSAGKIYVVEETP